MALKRWVQASCVLLALAGCGREEQSRPRGAGSSSSKPSTFESLGRKADEAIAKGEEKFDETREQAAARMEKTLDDLDAKIDNLKTKAGEAGEAAKAEKARLLAELEEKSTAARKRLNELKAHSGSAWSELSKSLGKAMGELKTGFDRAADQMKESSSDPQPSP